MRKRTALTAAAVIAALLVTGSGPANATCSPEQPWWCPAPSSSTSTTTTTTTVAPSSSTSTTTAPAPSSSSIPPASTPTSPAPATTATPGTSTTTTVAPVEPSTTLVPGEPTILDDEDCTRTLVTLVNTHVYDETIFMVQVGDDTAVTYYVQPNESVALTLPVALVRVWIRGELAATLQPADCSIDTPAVDAPVTPLPVQPDIPSGLLPATL